MLRPLPLYGRGRWRDPDQVQSCHGSTAAQHLGGGKNADYELIARMKQNYEATADSIEDESVARDCGQGLASLGYFFDLNTCAPAYHAGE